jgi:hypothetical protein
LEFFLFLCKQLQAEIERQKKEIKELTSQLADAIQQKSEVHVSTM